MQLDNKILDINFSENRYGGFSNYIKIKIKEGFFEIRISDHLDTYNVFTTFDDTKKVRINTNKEYSTLENILNQEDINIEDIKNSSNTTIYNQEGQVKTESEAFKKWFGDSKVVDENGEPLIVYHGTSANFDTFDNSKLGFSTDAKSAKQGIFFTSAKNVAEGYAKFATQEAPVDRLLKKSQELERQGKFIAAEKIEEEAAILEEKLLNSTFSGFTKDVYLSIKNPIIFNAKENNFNDVRQEIEDILILSKKKEMMVL